ncbi:Alpha/beta hydrolase fold-1 [Mycena alexandri]|uniref:Alpha/beta hydrolase fold-1 n=1 Tax=Mycena alexandri TaxID=1745969 RepID=A0AAD6WY60_9AGAR|nr:Alpha/beta hydrolase fold-1 [Mycena alexandri]
MPLEIASFVFDCPQSVQDAPGCLLKMSAKRYRTPESSRNSAGLSLLFTHCVGGHKEQWEPVIERILELRHSEVREAWAFDWQNHGDSAVLNHEILNSTPSRVYGVSAFEWSEAIAGFISSPHMRGRRILPVGHSAGAGTMVLTARNKPLRDIPYAALVLIEPTVIPRELFYLSVEDRVPTMEFVVTATTSRRERWRSREDAHSWLGRRIPWDSWDPRVLRTLSEHGLMEMSDGGVAIKCDRRQEALCYPDVEPHFTAAQELGRISGTIPVHFIWGDESPLVPQFVQDALADGSDGRKASVTKVQGGHMVVQEQPDKIADAICGIIDSVGRHTHVPQSKL